MSFKTLMVTLELGSANNARLKVAGDLAERFGAGVIGIALCQPLQLLYSDGGYVTGDIVEKDRMDIEWKLKEAEAQFRSALGVRAPRLEWRSDVLFEPLAAYIARHARRADLVITGVASGDWFDAARSPNVGDLIMQLGRPVLLVPATADALKLDHVVVGWKDTRECRRATLDALPLLKAAAHVAVIEIAVEADLAAARTHLDDVAAWLDRHGIAAETQALGSIGDDAARLKAVARDRCADLIVAGAYGHSRLREWALGGVTHDLLLRGDRCSLLSH
jgi:nucleotide-binding universal stress UspA family protein